MKIKSVESFTLKECQSYLEMNPDVNDRLAVEGRMRYLLKQIENIEDQKEQEEKLSQEHYQNDVKWIDIKQFLVGRPYKSLSRLKIISIILLFLPTFLLVTSAYFCLTPHEIYSSDLREQAEMTVGLEKILLELSLLDPYIYPSPGYYECTDLLYSVIVPLIYVLVILIIFSFTLSSPSLPYIYNVEKEEKIKSVRRTQNRAGKFGLHLCNKVRIIQLLSFKYDNIYYSGGYSYICIQGNKSGVYNAAMRRMVIDVAYDSINIMQDGTLAVLQNGVVSRYTTEGYRVVE